MQTNVTLQAATFITTAALTPLTAAETGAVNGAGGGAAEWLVNPPETPNPATP